MDTQWIQSQIEGIGFVDMQWIRSGYEVRLKVQGLWIRSGYEVRSEIKGVRIRSGYGVRLKVEGLWPAPIETRQENPVRGKEGQSKKLAKCHPLAVYFNKNLQMVV